MPQKTKATVGMKVAAVESYTTGKESPTSICERLGIAYTTLRRWSRIYETAGSAGLTPAQETKKHPLELKLCIVEEYLSDGISQADLCRKYNIADTRIVRRWIKKYNGQEDFKHPSRGGKIYMTKGRKTTNEERVDIVSYCVANNKDYSKTIEKHGVSYQQIYAWVRKYEKDGVDGLSDRRGKRKSESDMSEVEKLRAQLKLKEAENLRLQMENELLKKLDALERGADVD